MSSLDIEAIRRAALRASAGPWRIWEGDGGPNTYSHVVDPENRSIAVVTIGDKGHGREDLDFIAIANPATVLALLDRLSGV